MGFPGESEEEFQELVSFLSQARLDAIGIFPYSDEDGTEAAQLPGKLPAELIAERNEELQRMVEDLLFERANERIGERVDVLVEDSETLEGRAEHQGPEVDSTTFLLAQPGRYKVGEYVTAVVSEIAGADLVAQPI